MGVQLRPLWFALTAVVWAGLGFYFLTLKVLDPAGLDAIEALGASDVAVAAGVGALPWLAWSAALTGGFLWWIVVEPGYRAMRHAIAATVTGTLVAAAMYGGAIAAGYIEREATGLEAATVLAAMCAVLFVPAALIVGLVGNNRIWATPEPKRRTRFGSPPGEA